MVTQKQFTDLFNNENDAMDFEEQVLAVGDDFLPDPVLDVKYGQDLTSDMEPEYWAFMVSQVEASAK